MTQLFTNNAASTVAANMLASDTLVTLAAGDGAKFPNPSAGDDFLLTLFQRTGTTESNHEIVLVTARTNDTLTIVRAQEGTIARAFNQGDIAELRLTAGAVVPARAGSLTGALNEAVTVTLASSATMLVGTAKANTVNVSGTATISAFDSAPIGARRCTIFQGALTLTHSASALNLIGSANLITAAGDSCQWISTGGSKWTMLSYTRANGDAVGTVSIGHGGTGAQDAPTARANLGVPGLTSPTFATSLTVNNTAGEVDYTLGSGSGGKYSRFFYRAADDNFGMYLFDGTTGSTRMRFVGLTGLIAIGESGGNVVIGAGAEFSTEKLQVSGAVKASGGFVGNLTGTASAVAWSGVTGTPTTLAGYGITDSLMKWKGSYAAASVDAQVTEGDYTQQDGGTSSGVIVSEFPNTSTGTVQERFTYQGDYSFRNRTDNTNWTAWKTVITSLNVGSYALPIAGGTLTGALTLSGTAPVQYFTETDQAGAAGRWRLVADGGAWRADRNTSADGSFTAYTTDFSISPTGLVTLPQAAITTGITVPTMAPGNNTTNAASTAFVAAAVANLVNASPAALDTLKELADAINDDPNFAATTATALGYRLRVDVNNQGLTAPQQANARTNLALATVAASGAYGDLTGLPDLSLKQDLSGKDASSGYVGQTAFAHNFKNAGGATAGTILSKLINNNTAARTYTYPDKDITVAGTTNETLVNPTIKAYIEAFQALNTSGAITVSTANGTLIELTINASVTVTLPAAVAGMCYTLIVKPTGAFTPTFAGGTAIKWAGAAVPAATATNGKMDKYMFTCGSGYTLGQDGGRNF